MDNEPEHGIVVRSPLGTISVKNDEVSCGFVSEREYKALGLGRPGLAGMIGCHSRSPSLEHSPKLRLNKTKSDIWHPRVDDEEVEMEESF